MSALAPTLQAFFTDRLIKQRKPTHDRRLSRHLAATAELRLRTKGRRTVSVGPG